MEKKTKTAFRESIKDGAGESGRSVRQRSGGEAVAIRTTEMAGKESEKDEITQRRQEMVKLSAAVERLMAGLAASMHITKKGLRAEVEKGQKKREIPRMRQSINPIHEPVGARTLLQILWADSRGR